MTNYIDYKMTNQELNSSTVFSLSDETIPKQQFDDNIIQQGGVDDLPKGGGFPPIVICPTKIEKLDIKRKYESDNDIIKNILQRKTEDVTPFFVL